MKQLILCLMLLGWGALPVFSQESPEFAVDETASAFQPERSAQDDIDDFLAEKGFAEGRNVRGDNSEIFIATGVSVIQAPRNHPAYMRSRTMAFEKAMLAAKQQMAEYISTEIQTRAVHDFSEGEPPELRRQREAEAAAARREPGILDKTQILINAKLDHLLEEEGVDLGQPVPEEVVRKAVNSDVFEKFTRSAALARLVGMQAWKVFEASPDGKKGQIGVVAVYSEKLHKMADAVFSGNFSDLPAGTPKAPIARQLPKDPMVLLTTFGVQQKTDEAGNLVLVAFGQGAPRTDSQTSMMAAYDKAKMNAQAALRSFAGEIAAVENDLSSYENTQEFEDGFENYENEEYFKKRIETNAKALKISGIQQIRKWRATHPLTGHAVAGVVIAWSPDAATHAAKVGRKMAAEPAKTSRKVPGGEKTYKAGSNQGGSYRGAGAEADEDSF